MSSLSISSTHTFVNVRQDSLEKNRYLSGDELKEAREKPVELNLDGVIYASTRINFKSLSEQALQNEKITPGQQAQEGETRVAFYSPFDKDEVMTVSLDDALLGELQKEFGADDFFTRQDGIVRLNNDAQDYVANWYFEIGFKRGYVRADTDKNGKVEGSEHNALNVGFERRFNYGFVSEKVTDANLAGENGYQRYSDTSDYGNEQAGINSKSSFIYRQTLDFADTMEEELKNTLENDRDRDGEITLEEGLLGEVGGDEERLRQKVLDEVNKMHRHYLDNTLTPPPENKLIHRVLNAPKIIPEDEMMESFTAAAEPISIQNGDMAKLKFLTTPGVSEAGEGGFSISPIAFRFSIPEVDAFSYTQIEAESWDDEKAQHTKAREASMEYSLEAFYRDDPEREIDLSDPLVQRVTNDFENFYIKYVKGIDLQA